MCYSLKLILEIKETTIENSFGDSSIRKSNHEIISSEQKILILKDKYSVLLGPDTFKKVCLMRI